MIKKYPLLLFFSLAYAVLWGVAAGLWLTGTSLSGTGGLWALVGIYGASTAGLVAAYAAGGREGLMNLLRAAVRWRVTPRWYALAFVGVPLLVGGAAFSAALLGGTDIAWPTLVGWLFVLVGGTFQGAVGEELGWRGFALPRLLETTAPFWATVLLSVIWGAWHLPGFWLGVPPLRRLPVRRARARGGGPLAAPDARLPPHGGQRARRRDLHARRHEHNPHGDRGAGAGALPVRRGRPDDARRLSPRRPRPQVVVQAPQNGGKSAVGPAERFAGAPDPP